MNTAQYAIEPRSARRRPAAGVAHLSVRSLRRSINFFSLVLDFELISDRRREACPHVVMAARGCSRVVLRPLPAGVAAHAQGAASAVIAVADLDRARTRIWNAGLTVAQNDTTTAATVSDGARRLSVRDPDGNELELVEAAGELRCSQVLDGYLDGIETSELPASQAAMLRA